MRYALMALPLMLVLATVQAEVYSYKAKDGSVVFTDDPKKGGKTISLAPVNQLNQRSDTAPRRIKLSPGGKTGVDGQEPIDINTISQAMSIRTSEISMTKKASYDVFRILNPEPDNTITQGEGDLRVTVNSEPNLMPGHQYRVLVNGEPIADASKSPVFAVQNLERGTHQISAEILDEAGTIVERTPNQPIHIKRTSLVLKRQANPCEWTDFGVRPECPLSDRPALPPEDDGIPWLPLI